MISVTCAVIRNEDDEVLVVQRGEDSDHPLKWEFPGGKIDPGESEDECIVREIREELSMDIVIFGKLPEVDYDYGIKQIRLIPFICDTLDDLPFLTEHVSYKWVNPHNLLSTDFQEADVKVAEHYLERIGRPAVQPGKDPVAPSGEKTGDDDLKAMIDRMISMKQVEWVALSAVENPGILNKLIEFSYSEDSKLAFHASWILTKAFDKFPGITDLFLPQIVESLGRLDNESTLRSFLRILSLSDISKLSGRQQGMLTDFCFASLNSAFSAIAIKAYSMEILYRLSLVYPDLVPELAASLSRVFEYKSAGINSKAKTILRKLDIKEEGV